MVITSDTEGSLLESKLLLESEFYNSKLLVGK